jgi:hypothetical protein
MHITHNDREAERVSSLPFFLEQQQNDFSFGKKFLLD